MLGELIQVVEIELVHHLHQPRAADVIAGRQRIHVAFGLHGLSRVGTDHGHQGVIQPAPIGELEHRDVNAFHVHVGSVGTGADAADIGEMGGAGK